MQLTIPSGSEDQAREFYAEILGLEEIEKPDDLKARGGIWFSVGEQQLHLGIEDEEYRSKTRAHLALQVEDANAIKRSLEEKGFTTTDESPIEGLVRMKVRDPFGNGLEILGPE